MILTVATPDATPVSRRSRARAPQTERQIEIPDSDEPEVLTFETPGSKATFQGVLIPTRSAIKQEPRGRNAHTSRSKSTSLADSAEASDYETPGTSVDTTPIEPHQKKQPVRVSATARV